MKKINKILVIRFRRVGDAVISSVLCSSLKRSFPKAQIDYVLNENIAPLFLHHPDIDKLITFNENEMSSFKNYLKKVNQIVKDGQYDLIIDTRSTIKTLWFSLFSLKTPYRIGRKKSYNFLIHNYRVNTNDTSKDEVGKTLELLKPLEEKYKLIYQKDFRLYVSLNEKKEFAAYMQAQGIDLEKPIMICAVTARLKHKVWNPLFMQKILQKIVDNTDYQVVFNYGSEDEKQFAQQLHIKMDENPKIFTNIEAKNLPELAAMFANSNFFFGNEGGPRHISQAFDIPSFAIYPPQTSKKDWLPNACEKFQGIEPSEVSKLAKSDELSFTEKFNLITVEVLWDRLKKMLILE